MSAKNTKWKKLDNVALIFPSSSTKSDTHVFRFSCELDEMIDGGILQKALDDTIEWFPVFNYVMKRGMFWYYLESTDLRPIVTEESKPPCSELFDINQKKLMYEVTYYRKTLNFEIYHVLTDGTGAMHFLRMLVSKYLSYSHGFEELPIDYDASHTQMEDDGFRKHYAGKRTSKEKKPSVKAYTIRGQKLPENRMGIIRGHMSVKAVLAEAKKRGVTLTVLLTAALMCAISEEMTRRDMKKPVIISLPVNLRNYFKSESARNFFILVQLSYDFGSRSGEFEDVLEAVKESLSEQLTPEKLEDKLNSQAAIENNPFVRIAPLWFKDLVLRIAYIRTSKRYTAILSNVGILKLPEGYGECVNSFDVCNGTHKIQACVCSHADTLSVSFSSPFVSCDIQRAFFRRLAAIVPDIEITSNLNVEDNNAQV